MPGDVDIVTPLNPFDIQQLNHGNATTTLGIPLLRTTIWSDGFRHLTSWGPNSLVKGWTFSGTIYKHTSFPYSIWSSNAMAALQGALFAGTNPATTTAVPAKVVGTPHISCGAFAAQLINGQPNPCYNAANFADQRIISVPSVGISFVTRSFRYRPRRGEIL